MAKSILVTGASGQLGRKVLAELLKAENANIIATTRSPEKIAEFKAKGIEVRQADFNRPDSLENAFAGAERILIISTDSVGARTIQHRNAIEAAKNAGVRHLVYTSWVHPENSVALVAPEHAATEKMIRDSGLTYTILRNFPYAENLIPKIQEAQRNGVLFGCAGTGKVSYVTKADCARAAASALNSTMDAKVIMTVTGPRALEYVEVTRLASEVTGRKIIYQDLTQENYKEKIMQTGLSESVADLIVSFDLSAKSGEVSAVTSAVKDLTGRDPEDIAGFLESVKNSFKLFRPPPELPSASLL